MKHNPNRLLADYPGTAESHVPPRASQVCSTPGPETQR